MSNIGLCQGCRQERLFRCTDWDTALHLTAADSKTMFVKSLSTGWYTIQWLARPELWKTRQHEIPNAPLEIMTWTKLGQVLSQGGSGCSGCCRLTGEDGWMSAVWLDTGSPKRASYLVYELRQQTLQCLFAFPNTTRCEASFRGLEVICPIEWCCTTKHPTPTLHSSY